MQGQQTGWAAVPTDTSPFPSPGCVTGTARAIHSSSCHKLTLPGATPILQGSTLRLRSPGTRPQLVHGRAGTQIQRSSSKAVLSDSGDEGDCTVFRALCNRKGGGTPVRCPCLNPARGQELRAQRSTAYCEVAGTETLWRLPGGGARAGGMRVSRELARNLFLSVRKVPCRQENPAMGLGNIIGT